MLDSRKGTLVQQAVLDVWLNACPCWYRSWPSPSDMMNLYASLLACRSNVSTRSDFRQLMFAVLQAKWKNLDWVLVQKILYKKCLSELIKLVKLWLIRTQMVVVFFSEPSDNDTCKVNSPFSNEEEEVVQPEPDRGTERICRALPKCANTDFELG